MRVVSGLLLFFFLAYGAVPPEVAGLELKKEAGVFTYEGAGTRIVYVPGVGWAPPLPPGLPPPEKGGALSPEVLRAAGVWDAQKPVVRLRYAAYPERLRLVFDLGRPLAFSRQIQDRPPFSLRLPLYPDRFPDLPGLSFRTSPAGTSLVFTPEPGRVGFLHAFALADPPRLVVDLYAREPEWSRVLAPGIRLRMRYAPVPYPLKLILVEAEPGRFRLVPVGKPGLRRRLGAMAPKALALLNGGYFDPKTAAPIGLWVVDGVTLSYPYGRSALVWDGGRVDAVIPRFSAWVELSGRRYPVGLAATPARYTAYTTPGEVGRPGEAVLVVEAGRVVARRDAPYALAAGRWALAYPKGALPFSAVPLGTELRLRVRLVPPVRYALEAGPLLVQRGAPAYRPERERFAKNAIPLTKVTYQAAVAWTQDGGLWLVVSEKTTPGVLARGLAELGAWGAIRMDSGGSAQLWAKGKLVYPKRAREVVNGLALYPALGQ